MLERADIALALLNRQKRRSMQARPRAIGLTVLLFLIAQVITVPGGAAERTFEFTIAAQPLSSALAHYGDVTGKEALYEGGLIDRRMSGGFEGQATPTGALKQLLVGTGLTARFVAEGIFILELAPDRSAPTSASRRYHTLVQRDVLEALCGLPQAKPGQYRLVTAFWIAPDGAVQDMLRIGSAGSLEIDALIDRTLRAMRFREPPPSNFVQPIRLLLTQHEPAAAADCAVVDVRPATREDAR
jgi:hypothetical protein